MLIIYGILPLGGIETFYLRLAKKRYELGMKTKLLLICNASSCDEKLLTEIRNYADVYFTNDLFVTPPLISRFPLLLKARKDIVKELFQDVEQIHVYEGMHGLLARKLTRLIGLSKPISVGVYHSKKFLWGKNNVPFYERINRQFVFEYLPHELIYFFSSEVKKLYSDAFSMPFPGSGTFRLGVIDKKDERLFKFSGNDDRIRICIVGRLVGFKTYIHHSIFLIKELVKRGVEVTLDIFGDGPEMLVLLNEVEKQNLDDVIELKGSFDYEYFDEIVREYDLFIGSGTSVIQASSLGVPSIIGVEHNPDCSTYGFFSEVYESEYNMLESELELIPMLTVVEDYLRLDLQDKKNLKNMHVNAAQCFDITTCLSNFEKRNLIKMPESEICFSVLRYEISRFFSGIFSRLNKSHARNFGGKSFK